MLFAQDDVFGSPTLSQNDESLLKHAGLVIWPRRVSGVGYPNLARTVFGYTKAEFYILCEKWFWQLSSEAMKQSLARKLEMYFFVFDENFSLICLRTCHFHRFT